MNADMLDKRVAILKKVDALTNKCNCETAKEMEKCSNCKQLTKYGHELLALVNSRIRLNASIDRVPISSSRLPLTKAQYLKLKQAGKTDRYIADMLGASCGALQNWKKLNNVEVRIRGKRLKAK